MNKRFLLVRALVTTVIGFLLIIGLSLEWRPVGASTTPARAKGLPRIMWQAEVWFFTQPAAQFHWQEMKNWGITVVQANDLAIETDANVKFYLDAAQAHKLGVLVSLNAFISGGRTVPPTLDREGLTAFVRKWRNHPAIWGWELNEPDSLWLLKSFQGEYYATLKKADPNPNHRAVTVWGAWCWSWEGCYDQRQIYECCFEEKTFDILAVDFYPYNAWYGTEPRTQYIVDRMAILNAYRTKEYPIVAVLQAFDGADPNWWEVMPPDAIRDQWDAYQASGAGGDGVGYYAWVASAAAPYYFIYKRPNIYEQVIALNSLVGAYP